MTLFPVFLDLAHKSCLVVGGGRVGLDKARTLAAAGASVVVVDPAPSADLTSAAAGDSRLTIEAREFQAGDCRGRVLVFACTGVQSVDEAVSAASRATGALCCRADGSTGDFTTGATIRQGEVCVAVSSGAASPGLAMEARRRIEGVVGPEFGDAARLLGELRVRLRDEVADSRIRREVLGGPVVREVLFALEGGNLAKARAAVEEAVAAAGAREEGRCTR